MRATSTRVATGDRLQAALLYLPAASQGDVMVEGATLEVSDRGGGSREVYVYPQGGAYHVHLVTTASGGTVLPNTSR